MASNQRLCKAIQKMRVTVGSQGESIKMMEEGIDSTERTISKGFKM
jgi:hypothetical protein